MLGALPGFTLHVMQGLSWRPGEAGGTWRAWLPPGAQCPLCLLHLKPLFSTAVFRAASKQQPLQAEDVPATGTSPGSELFREIKSYFHIPLTPQDIIQRLNRNESTSTRVTVTESAQERAAMLSELRKDVGRVHGAVTAPG